MSTVILPKNFKGYKLDEPIEGSYYRIPKALNDIEYFDEDKKKYQNLSSDSKLLYGLLLDRMELSRKNGWKDNEGNLYLLFSRIELEKILKLSRPTITKSFKQLIKAGLIYEIRQGQNKPNIIYVGKIPDELRKEKIFPTGEKEFFPPEGKNLSPNDPYINKTDINKTDLKNTRDFSDGTEKSSLSSLKNKQNYSEWNRIMALKFPNNLPEYTLKRFVWEYKRNMEQDHPSLKNQQLERCFEVLDAFFEENDIDSEEDINVIIAKYFKTNFPNANYGEGCDYNFNHFCTEGVLLRRFWEELL